MYKMQPTLWNMLVYLTTLCAAMCKHAIEKLGVQLCGHEYMYGGHVCIITRDIVSLRYRYKLSMHRVNCIIFSSGLCQSFTQKFDSLIEKKDVRQLSHHFYWFFLYQSHTVQLFQFYNAKWDNYIHYHILYYTRLYISLYTCLSLNLCIVLHIGLHTQAYIHYIVLHT